MRAVLQQLTAILPFSLLYRGADPDIVAPCYHAISDRQLPHIRHLFDVRSPEMFGRDLDFLLARFSPISIAELAGYLRNGEPVPRKSLLVTFDDGLREAYEIALPILQAKGVPAVFFVSPAFLDNRDLSYRFKTSVLVQHIGSCDRSNTVLDSFGLTLAALLDLPWESRHLLDDIAERAGCDFKAFAQDQRPYMATEEVEKLITFGHFVGAHSIDHPPYRCLDRAEQIRQTVESMASVRRIFDLDYGVFAFPFNDIGLTHSFYETVSESRLFDVFFGTTYLKQDRVRASFQRFPTDDRKRSMRNLLAWLCAKKIGRRLLGRDLMVRDLIARDLMVRDLIVRDQ